MCRLYGMRITVCLGDPGILGSLGDLAFTQAQRIMLILASLLSMCKHLEFESTRGKEFLQVRYQKIYVLIICQQTVFGLGAFGGIEPELWPLAEYTIYDVKTCWQPRVFINKGGFRDLSDLLQSSGIRMDLNQPSS